MLSTYNRSMKKALVYAVVALVLASCDNNNNSSPTDPSQVNIEFTTTDLVVGTGAEATSGTRVSVHYTLWLYDSAGAASKGRQLQTSVGGNALQFTVSSGQLIRGFDQAVLGMRVGGKRRAYVPSSLGYGSAGSQDGSIPPNAALVFEIDLISIP
jgi:FKBP-type peptidyl-prolyl cis-trans isomerase FkpA